MTTTTTPPRPDSSAQSPLDHPNNITVGTATIVYAPSQKTKDNTAHPQGWVLPGGKRTIDRATAVLAAVNIYKHHPLK